MLVLYLLLTSPGAPQIQDRELGLAVYSTKHSFRRASSGTRVFGGGVTDMDCWKWLPLGADRHTLYCFIVRIVFRNALDTSAGRKEELDGGVEESDARATNSWGHCHSFVRWGHIKKERGHTRKRVDMCGDPWENRKTASL